MNTNVIDFANVRMNRAVARSTPPLPVAVNRFPGAVQVIVGAADDEEAKELWLTAEQAVALGRELVCAGKDADAML